MLKQDSAIDIVPVGSSGGTAAVITNSDGSRVTKDIVIVIDENGQVEDIDEEGQIASRAGTTGQFDYSNKITIRATAVYNQRSYDNIIFSYYQPIGMYFIYSKNQECDVSYIRTTYRCAGFEFTYPGMQDLGEGIYTHDTIVSQENPRKNTIYHAMNEYRADRVIYTGSGHFSIGNVIMFHCIVNGRTVEWEVMF